VLLATQAPEQALALLGRWHTLAADQGRTGSVIEVQALRALAHAAGDDEPAALACLADALTLAAAEGYLRVFIDEGPPMAALLRKLLGRPAADDVPRDYLAGLLDAFERHGMPVLPPPRAGAVAVPGLLEPLTARELDVLRLLGTGKSNREIAEELVVSLDTVKRHVSNLFDKLGVANRTQAVNKARELGLLA
jgi:LuxR family transcriptional regulator, maltose regulon positive regulatory protein